MNKITNKKKGIKIKRGRVYIDKNVYDATSERLDIIFKDFKKIYVSFSGGKDSGALLNMCIDKARKSKRKIGCLFIDVEAFYSASVDFVERMIFNNLDVLEPFWVCLPMESPNSLSYLDPTWIWWDKGKESIWVRKMPRNQFVINEKNNKLDFYEQNMPFERFIKYFGDWYGKEEKTACLLGLRTDESLNRFRAIFCANKVKYKKLDYSTKMNDRTYNFCPIYDWTVSDVWTYNAKFNKDYNKLYDLFYKAGVNINKMRLDEPFGNSAKAGLSLFKVIEPQTWSKVVNRVSGANFGNIYNGNKIMNSAYTLPKNHTWKSFTKFLLKTLPAETAKTYKHKFIKFIKYWHRVGCPVADNNVKILEDKYAKYIINTHRYSNRGTKDREVIKFKRIADELPGLDSKLDYLTWRRMAMCIIKNDIICYSLSFSITKFLTLRQKELEKKYKNL
jgi:predicted phosphoadenosine phosphosulfate sulfurtransferase